MQEDLWYYEIDGEQYGPVTQAELQQKIERGEVSRDNLAWRPGEADWSETGSFEMLIPSFKVPPPVKKQEEPLELRPVPPPPPPPPPQPQPQPVQPVPVVVRIETTSPQPAPAQQAMVHTRDEEQEPGTELERQEPALHERIESGTKAVKSFKGFLEEAKPLLKPLFDWLKANPWRQVSALLLVVATPSTAYYMLSEQSGLHGTRVPAGYEGPVGQIKIDAYPWAELTALRSPSQGDLPVPGALETPLVLLVAPGSYQVELNGELACVLEVAHEQSRTCSKVVRRVDADAYFQEVGW